MLSIRPTVVAPAVAIALALAAASLRAAAQTPVEARPDAVVLGTDAPRTEVFLRGEGLDAVRTVVIVDERGAPAKALEGRLGRMDRDGRWLELALADPVAGEYGLLLEGGKEPVPVRLRITVEVAAAPPRIVDIGGPDQRLVGETVRLGVAARGERPVVSLEIDQGYGLQRVDVGPDPEIKTELELRPFEQAGAHRITLWAVDADGVRSEPDEWTVDIREPAPVPELATVSMDRTELGPGMAAEITLRLTVRAPDGAVLTLDDGLPAGAPDLGLPGTVEVPPGADEVRIPFAVPGPDAFSGAWEARMSATLDGTTRMADWALRGTPSVVALDAPDMLVSGETMRLTAMLGHAAPPGGTSVTFDVRNMSGQGPWVVGVPEGASEATVEATVEHSGTFPMSLTARTPLADHPEDPTVEAMLHPRPELQGVYPLEGPSIRGSVTGEVRLGFNDVAPPGGIEVALEAEPADRLVVPTTVTVPEGQDRVSFPIDVPTPPVAEVVDVTLRATMLGETVENAYPKLWPLEPFLEALTLFDPFDRPVFVPGHEIRLAYVLAGVFGDAALEPLDVQVGPGAVLTPEPGTDTPSGGTGSLRLRVDDVTTDGPVTITVGYGGASHAVDVPVGRPRMAAVTFHDSGVSGGPEITDFQWGTGVNVMCRFRWTLPGGAVENDLPHAYEEDVTVQTDRPDLIDVAPTVPIRYRQGGESAWTNTSCRPTQSVLEPTVVTVSGTVGGQTASAELTLLPTAAPLDALHFNSAFNQQLVLGLPFRLQAQTYSHAAGQNLRLTSSDPSLLVLPEEVPLEAGTSHVLDLTAPVPDGIQPPFPRTVIITAEAGGVSRNVSVPVLPQAWLAGMGRGSGVPERPYPGEFVNVGFTVGTPGGPPPDGYEIQLSTDRPEVFVDFPAVIPASSSAPSVTLDLAAFDAGGPVTITANDGATTRELTLTLARPALRGVDFELLGAGDDQGAEWVVQDGSVTRLLAADLASPSGTPAARVLLECGPSFDLRPTAAEWTQSVALSTDRPDLLTLPSEVAVTFRGQGSGGVAVSSAPCEVDLSALTEVTNVSVTATYGAEQATSVLELVPAVPSAVSLSIVGAESGTDDLRSGSSAELRVPLSAVAPNGTGVTFSAAWAPGIGWADGEPDPLDVLEVPPFAPAGGLSELVLGVPVGALPPAYHAPLELTVAATMGGASRTTTVRIAPRAWIERAEAEADRGAGFDGDAVAFPGGDVRFVLTLTGAPGSSESVSVVDDGGVFESPPTEFVVGPDGISPPFRVRSDAPAGQVDLMLEMGGVRTPVTFEIEPG
ncbi:MAG: hypothetical protein RJQ04_17250 [Longimicrobiales bacterium]